VQSYIAEVAVKLRMGRDDYAYYPDVMVVCGREKAQERFFTDPELIVEVLSPSTTSVDRHEKRIAYRRIAALEEYVIVAQDAIEVTAWRREESWEPAALESLDSALEFRSLGLCVPLAHIYEGECP
jgi:Uma2 family endonuclease